MVKEYISFPEKGILDIFNEKDLKKLINEYMLRSERSYIDFKINNPKEIENLVSAFANTKSGFIIFGIGDSGPLEDRWKGIDDPNDLNNSINQRLKDSLGENLEYITDTVLLNEKYYIFLYVPVVEKWIPSKGRYYIREGDSIDYLKNPDYKKPKNPPIFGFYFLEILKSDIIIFNELETSLNKGFFKNRVIRVTHDIVLSFKEYADLINPLKFPKIEKVEKCCLIYKILYNTDCLPKEVCNLRFNQIKSEFRHNFISVENIKMSISPDLFYEICEFAKKNEKVNDDYIFGNQMGKGKGKGLNPNWLTKILKEQLFILGISEKVTLKTFRLSYIVHYNKKNREILSDESLVFSRNEILEITDLEKYSEKEKNRKWVLFYNLVYNTIEYPGTILKLKVDSLLKVKNDHYIRIQSEDIKIKEKDYAHLIYYIHINGL